MLHTMKQNPIAISFYARGRAGCSKMLCANTALNLCSLSQVSKQQLIFLVKKTTPKLSRVASSGSAFKKLHWLRSATLTPQEGGRSTQKSRESRFLRRRSSRPEQSRFYFGHKITIHQPLVRRLFLSPHVRHLNNDVN